MRVEYTISGILFFAASFSSAAGASGTGECLYPVEIVDVSLPLTEADVKHKLEELSKEAAIPVARRGSRAGPVVGFVPVTVKGLRPPTAQGATSWCADRAGPYPETTLYVSAHVTTTAKVGDKGVVVIECHDGLGPRGVVYSCGSEALELAVAGAPWKYSSLFVEPEPEVPHQGSKDSLDEAKSAPAEGTSSCRAMEGGGSALALFGLVILRRGRPKRRNR